MTWNILCVLYDIPNETVEFCEFTTEVTDEMHRKNVIKMPAELARKMRTAKGLPMPEIPEGLNYKKDVFYRLDKRCRDKSKGE